MAAIGGAVAIPFGGLCAVLVHESTTIKEQIKDAQERTDRSMAVAEERAQRRMAEAEERTERRMVEMRAGLKELSAEVKTVEAGLKELSAEVKTVAEEVHGLRSNRLE